MYIARFSTQTSYDQNEDPDKIAVYLTIKRPDSSSTTLLVEDLNQIFSSLETIVLEFLEEHQDHTVLQISRRPNEWEEVIEVWIKD